MQVKLLNLDDKENVVIVVSYDGKTLSLRANELIALIEATSTDAQLPARGQGRSLASIGKIIGIVRRDSFDALTPDDCRRLVAAIRGFDGYSKGKRSSQVGRWLRDIMEWKTASSELKVEIGKFLNLYPDLETIPIRKLPERRD